MTIDIAKQADGSFLVGGETISGNQLEAKLNELAPAGNFRVAGQVLNVDQVVGQFSSSNVRSSGAELPPPTGSPADLGNLAGKANDSVGMIQDMMRLFHEIAVEQRKSGRLERHAARETEQAEIGQQVDKLKESAEKAYTAAIKQAVTQIFVGVVTVAASAVSIFKLGQAAKAAKAPLGDMQKATNAVADATTKAARHSATVAHSTASASMNAANNMATQAQAITTAAQSGGQLAQGVGGLMAAGDTKQAEFLRAEATEQEAEAKKASYAVQDENEWMANMRDMIRDVQQKLATIQQAEIETLKNISRA